MAVTKINEFMERIGKRGGMSLTTGFDVQFDFQDSSAPFAKMYYAGDDKDIVHMMCDEAQLPNVQSAVAQMNNRYLGEGTVAYPHTRIFTDLSLGFLLDAKLTSLKFFQSWYDYIYGDWVPTDQYSPVIGVARGHKDTTEKARNRVNRLKFQDDYMSTLRIIKTEPGPVASNHRAPITYLLENCYPYAIDAVPLSYGTSQTTRVNVNFYYSRHTVKYGSM